MKSVPIFFIVIFLAGCVSLQQKALNEACDTSKEVRSFPGENSEVEILVRFELMLDQDRININELVTCDYQGSFCPAGDWYDVWYGNKELKHEVRLPQERVLSIWHHGLCTTLDSFKKQCPQGKCDPKDYFEFRLVLNAEDTQRRKEECSKRVSGGVTNDPEEFARCGIPNVDMVTLKELEDYGYKIENESIEVPSTSL